MCVIHRESAFIGWRLSHTMAGHPQGGQEELVLDQHLVFCANTLGKKKVCIELA